MQIRSRDLPRLKKSIVRNMGTLFLFSLINTAISFMTEGPLGTSFQCLEKLRYFERNV